MTHCQAVIQNKAKVLNAIKNNIQDIQNTDVYTLRRIVPEDRNKKWS